MKKKSLESFATDATFSQGHHRALVKNRKDIPQQHAHQKRGRFAGVNRYGEYHPHASHYDEDDHRIPWSHDLRSEGHFKDHSGKGPKGYIRKDERILEEVCDYLTEHPDLDASKLQVSVKDGTVTLLGQVRSAYEMNAVESIVNHTSGVRDIVDKIEILDRYS